MNISSVLAMYGLRRYSKIQSGSFMLSWKIYCRPQAAVLNKSSEHSNTRELSTHTFRRHAFPSNISAAFLNGGAVPTVAHVRERGLVSSAVQCDKWRPSKSTNRTSSEIIYIGPLSKKMKLIKLFSLFTSTIGFVFASMVHDFANESTTGLTFVSSIIVCTLSVITPFLLHLIIKNYVVVLRYDPLLDRYSAETISFLLRPKRTKFQAEEVQVPDVDGIFTTFKVRGRSFFVDSALVDPLEHYGRLMKLDNVEASFFMRAAATASEKKSSSSSSSSS